MYVWTAQFHCKMVMPLKCRSLKQGTIPATGRMMNWRQTYFLACSYNMFSLHACTILHTLKCSCRSRCRCHMILPCRTCANCRSAS